MVSNIMNEEDLTANKQVFRFIDKDQTGEITSKELC